MNIQGHINYHDDKIDRLQSNVEQQTSMLASRSHPHPLARAEDVRTTKEQILEIEIEIRISREIRSTLIDIQSENSK